jgi:hypothetical protein
LDQLIYPIAEYYSLFFTLRNENYFFNLLSFAGRPFLRPATPGTLGDTKSTSNMTEMSQNYDSGFAFYNEEVKL